MQPYEPTEGESFGENGEPSANRKQFVRAVREIGADIVDHESGRVSVIVGELAFDVLKLAHEHQMRVVRTGLFEGGRISLVFEGDKREPLPDFDEFTLDEELYR